jgi:hypothetical protein
LVEEDEPEILEAIPNITVAVGRDARIPCKVRNLGTYRVSQSTLFVFCGRETTQNILPLFLCSLSNLLTTLESSLDTFVSNDCHFPVMPLRLLCPYLIMSNRSCSCEKGC